jgi:hypothetical protein
MPAATGGFGLGGRPSAAPAPGGSTQGGGYSQYGYGQGQDAGYNLGDQWTSVISLAPAQQQLLNTQNQISQSLGDTSLSGLGRVGQAMQTPFSTGGMPSLKGAPQQGPLQTSVNTDFTGLQNKATDAAMARQTQQLDQQQQQMSAQLANQGITPGSQAYDNAMRPLQQARVDAQNQAFLTGTNYAQQLFGEGLQGGQFANQAQNQVFNQGLAGNQFGNQARQQAIGEEAYTRQLPLNELNALRSGSQVQAPQFSMYSNAQQVAPAPIFGAAQAQGQAAQQAYANQVGGSNSLMSGLFGLGGSAIMGAGNAGGFSNLFSDRRLKRNVKRIGTYNGLPWYYFEYIWGEPSVGVMADEVVKVRPEAVGSSGGFATVDYGRL